MEGEGQGSWTISSPPRAVGQVLAWKLACGAVVFHCLGSVCRRVFRCWGFYFVIVIVFKCMAGTGSAG